MKGENDDFRILLPCFRESEPTARIELGKTEEGTQEREYGGY